LKFCPDIPGKVVINEAIELAKKYSAEQSPRFVNGVLDAIFRKLTDSDTAVGAGGGLDCETGRVQEEG
jgi:N utilization substance protein B